MTSLVGTRLFIHFTGVEVAQVLPIDHGEALSQEPGFYTVLGEVSGEYAGGIQFRLEKIFGRHDEEMQSERCRASSATAPNTCSPGGSSGARWWPRTRSRCRPLVRLVSRIRVEVGLLPRPRRLQPLTLTDDPNRLRR
jgi:hypothetical protein